MPRTSLFLRALPGLFVATSLAHAEPARHATPAIRVEGDMLRLTLPRSSAIPALPKITRARLDAAIAASCGDAARKDPRYFLAWLDATLEARVMTALASAPSHTGVTPETARNVAEFSDPMLYIRWLLTGTDPVYFKAIVERAEASADAAARHAEARDWRRLPDRATLYRQHYPARY